MINISVKLRTHQKKITQRQIRKIAARFLVEVKAYSLVDTGLFQKSWRIKITATGFKVVNRVKYAGFLESGTAKKRRGGFVKPTARKLTPFVRELTGFNFSDVFTIIKPK